MKPDTSLEFKRFLLTQTQLRFQDFVLQQNVGVLWLACLATKCGARKTNVNRAKNSLALSLNSDHDFPSFYKPLILQQYSS